MTDIPVLHVVQCSEYTAPTVHRQQVILVFTLHSQLAAMRPAQQELQAANARLGKVTAAGPAASRTG